MSWERPQGGLHTRWLDMIKEDLQWLNVTLENAEGPLAMEITGGTQSSLSIMMFSGSNDLK